MRTPYIAIESFENFRHVEEMLSFYRTNCPGNVKHSLQVGVSFRNIREIVDKNRKSGEGPQAESELIQEIFGSNKVMNCLHYNIPYESSIHFQKKLFNVISSSGPNIHAVQFDVGWPPPEDVWAMNSAEEILRCSLLGILHVDEKALSEVGNTPAGLVDRLRDYSGIISQVVLTKGLANGRYADIKEILPFVRKVRQGLPDVGVTIGAVFTYRALELARPLLKKFPDLSLSQLGSNTSTDVNQVSAQDYLITALSMLED